MIDLHMHSTASDGTDTIPELLKKVRAAGIDIFAVTDHDTIDGSMEMEGIVPEDMTFIRGIEFSCITEAGQYHNGYAEKYTDRNGTEIVRMSITLEGELGEVCVSELDFASFT